MAMRKDQIADNKFTLPNDARDLALYVRQITQNVKAERKRLFRLAQLIKAGEKPASALYEQYGSWKAHAAKGNSKKLLQRMDQYVKSLLEGITT